MGEIALWGTFEALPGKDHEAEDFFAETGEIVATEAGTTSFYAVKIGPGKYGMFETYADESALQVHQAGPAGQDTVMGAVGVVFAAAPEMSRSIVFHSKIPVPGPDRHPRSGPRHTRAGEVTDAIAT